MSLASSSRDERICAVYVVEMEMEMDPSKQDKTRAGRRRHLDLLSRKFVLVRSRAVVGCARRNDAENSG